MKVAWFQGDIEQPEAWDGTHYSMEQILAFPPGDPRTPILTILLVPDDFDLTQMWGDDWNDAPADCNAGRPCLDTLPEGHLWLHLRPGSPWQVPR